MVAKQHISEDLKRFIKENIQTMLRLEVLLLLHQRQPGAFTAAEVAGELNFDNETTAQELMALEADGLVAHVQSDKFKYTYRPLNPTLESLIEELAMGYSQQRVPILSAMLAEHPDRIRCFAEAFRIIRGNN